MTWGDWMVVEWTIEEELRIESQSRSALMHPDDRDVRSLCASLIKQNAYYNRLLQQATGRIAELETSAFLGQHQPKPTHRSVMALANRAARYAKLLSDLTLCFFRRAYAVIAANDRSILTVKE